MSFLHVDQPAAQLIPARGELSITQNAYYFRRIDLLLVLHRIAALVVFSRKSKIERKQGLVGSFILWPVS
jgi:hypothetical protein